MEYIDPKLLEKYAAGECSETERLEVEKWLDAEQDLPVALTSTFSAPEREEMEALLWSGIQAKRGDGSTSRWKINLRFLFAAAACMALAIVATLYVLKDLKSVNSNLTVYQAGNGRLDTLMLNDGSRIILNAGAKIIYPKKFNGTLRKVTLVKGEAFFEVKKNPKQPFLVRTDGTSVLVLGTKFNISKSRAQISVILKEGRVAFKEGRDSVVLLPGQRAVYEVSKGISRPQPVDLKQYLSWQSGTLLFEDRPMSEVLDALGKRYNLNFIIERQNMDQLLFTGKISGKDAGDALKLLMLSSDLKFDGTGGRKIKVY